MKDFLIREATVKDAKAIHEVQRAAWLTTYINSELNITSESVVDRFSDEKKRAGKWIEKIEASDNTVWVAVVGDEVVGFCCVEYGDEEKENRIASIYIHPDYQGHHIGTAFMEKAIAFFGQDEEVRLNVASFNDKAVSFYRKFGFEIDPEIPEKKCIILNNGAALPEIEMVRKLQV